MISTRVCTAKSSLGCRSAIPNLFLFEVQITASLSLERNIIVFIHSPTVTQNQYLLPSAVFPLTASIQRSITNSATTPFQPPNSIPAATALRQTALQARDSRSDELKRDPFRLKQLWLPWQSSAYIPSLHLHSPFPFILPTPRWNICFLFTNAAFIIFLQHGR